MSSHLKSSLRIILAIAAKDILDALKNKVTLSIMIGSLVMALTGLALPLLSGFRSLPTALVYDPDRSTLIKALTIREEFILRPVDSEADLMEALLNTSSPALGLVIPHGFRHAAESGGNAELQGYYAHWSDLGKIAAAASFFETELSRASWQSVYINTQDHPVYPAPDGEGVPYMVSLTATIMVLIMGLAIVPYLLVEEKETHTLEAVLVSPANFSQVVLGKALVGVFYCLLSAGIVLVSNARMLLHWDVALLAILAGAAFTVSLGLLAGVLTNNPANINLYMVGMLIFLILPAVFGAIQKSHLPAAIQSVIPWIPSAALNKLFRLSMSGSYPPEIFWKNLAVLLVAAVIVYGCILWKTRRMDH